MATVNPARHNQMQRVTWISTGVDLALAATKLITGVLVRSPALIADGLHSFSDLITDFFVLVINRVAHTGPDQNHPYGHGRFETLGTVLIGAVLVGVSVGLAWDNANRLLGDDSPALPSVWAISVAALSLISKEALYRYGKYWARRLDSPLLEANAWHSRSDAWSSLVVLAGVVATWLGFGWIEAWAALVVAFMIGKMGVTLAWNALQDLADRGISPEREAAIRRTIEAMPGVISAHELRTRLMGHQLYLDVHIQVGPYLSVSEGHQIGDWTMRQLHREHRDISDITLHVDPEDDSEITKREMAPLRPQINQALGSFPALAGADRMNVHYRKQRVELELYFPDLPGPAEERERAAALSTLSWLARIDLYGPAR